MGTLRLFLALSVAFGHFGMPLGLLTSDIAVQSFFVISGFYMALVLNEKYEPGSYWLFVSNRLLRLWPTYAVVLVFSFAIASNWRPIVSLDLPSFLYFIASQILIVGQESYFFLFISNGGFAFTLHPSGMLHLLYTFAPIPQAWGTSHHRSDHCREPDPEDRACLGLRFQWGAMDRSFLSFRNRAIYDGFAGLLRLRLADDDTTQAGEPLAAHRSFPVVRLPGPQQVGRCFAADIVVVSRRRDHRCAAPLRTDQECCLGPISRRAFVSALYLPFSVRMATIARVQFERVPRTIPVAGGLDPALPIG
jgi:hypothetical protein